MLRSIALRLVPLVLVFVVSGCATVTRGTKDTLVVESDPAGAQVTLSTGETGKTPATFKLPRKNPVVVKIEREGYEPVEVNVIPTVVGSGAAGMAGNVLVGGLIGVAVDSGTGAMKDLKPNPVTVKLVALSGPAAAVAAAPEPTPPLAPAVQPAVAAPSEPTPPLAAMAQAPAAASDPTVAVATELKAAPDQEKRLHDLDELHGKGMISDEEYNNTRAQILAGQ